jgi:hypothetical protein
VDAPPGPPSAAEIWTGSGPILALPALTPTSDSGANAAVDNSNVAGWSVDDNNVIQPVIWTCAVQQAYEP